MFADLHCHPALFVFNRLRNSDVDGDPGRFNAWIRPRINKLAERKGGRATRYTQVHPTKMAAGELRIAFASITPIEKGFFKTGTDVSDWKKELASLLIGKTFFKVSLDLLKKDNEKAGRSATGVLRNNGPIRLLFQRVFMGYSLDRIRYLKGEVFDYWDEYQREMDFYFNGQDELNGGWHYSLIDSSAALKASVEKEKDLAMILTIEGGHTFSVNADESIVDDETIFSRIDFMKDQSWPVFFITFSHHFYNGLCGHAKSIMDSGGLLLDQKEGLGDGFTKLGWKTIRKLLSVDEKNKDLEEPRILIDCKHMSPLGRQQYYRDIVEPYNARKSKKREMIPVIISHAAYNTFSTLDELIENLSREDDNFCRNGFLAWGINYCDEDIFAVVKSQGLLGLCFDRRICGVRAGDKLTEAFVKNALLKQIFATIEVVWKDDSMSAHQKSAAWDCITIGSDFDGVIDPLPRYASATELTLFADDLKEALENRKSEFGIAEIGVENIVAKISWKNAYDFAMKHFDSNLS